MKNKIIFLITCLIVMTSFKPLQKVDDNQLYKVIIFKWSKNDKGEEQEKEVVINQDGKIIINDQASSYKINIKKFTKAVNLFIKTEKLIKELANNEPPKMNLVPKNGEQFISITIIKLIDFNNQKDFANPSQYSIRKIKKSSDINIELYKYLQSDDLAVLKKLLG